MNFWLKADFPLDQVPGALEISGLRLFLRRKLGCKSIEYCGASYGIHSVSFLETSLHDDIHAAMRPCSHAARSEPVLTTWGMNLTGLPLIKTPVVTAPAVTAHANGCRAWGLLLHAVSNSPHAQGKGRKTSRGFGKPDGREGLRPQRCGHRAEL